MLAIHHNPSQPPLPAGRQALVEGGEKASPFCKGG